MSTLAFDVTKRDEKTKARLGIIKTAHGTIETPVFMPVGTRGAVKTVTTQQLLDIDTQIIVANTYHLLLRPGKEIIDLAGGLHSFMKWPKPILTDSGGFQVFSLSTLNKVTDDGVHFQSHIDGSHLFLGPIESMEMQKVLGADIALCLDEYPISSQDDNAVIMATKRTLQWAKICHEYPLQAHQHLFCIIQGGLDKELRRHCASELVAMNFSGYAIGGLSGESSDDMYEIVDCLEPYLPAHQPRYLMGVGTPRNIIEAVMRGVDMFDCVLPTRAARGGTAYTWQGKINIAKGRYAKDFSALDPEMDTYASKFSKAYIRHLFNVDEITGLSLLTMQNLAFYHDFMMQLRQAIRTGSLLQFYEKVVSLYPI